MSQTFYKPLIMLYNVDANHLKNRKRLIKLMTEVVDSCRGETALMRSLARFVPVIIKRNAQLRNVLDSGKRKPHTGGIADKHFNTGKPSRTRLKGHGEKAPGKSTKKVNMKLFCFYETALAGNC